jgi:hypothetical protein
MSNIELKKSDIPFWFGGDGVLKVDVNVVDPMGKTPGLILMLPKIYYEFLISSVMTRTPAVLT